MAVLPPDPVFVLRSSSMGAVNSICFHKNEKLIAGTAKGTIHLWDLQTTRSLFHFEVSTNPITSVHHLDDLLITQEKGGYIKCWSLSNSGYEIKSSYECDHIAFCRPDFLPEINALVFPKQENEISLLSLNDYRIKDIAHNLQTKLGHISTLKAVNINGYYYILASYESGDILTWDLRGSKVINQVNFGEIPMALDYDVKTNRGVCGGTGDKITVFSYLLESMELRKKSEISIKNAGINCLKIRWDQKVFASGGWDGRVRIFSWKSLRPLAVLTEHKNGGVMDICYSLDTISLWKAPIMAAGGVDGQISLWDLYN